jgi:FtsP/CotA-like multicopper oxidase with cupredoxin domain
MKEVVMYIRKSAWLFLAAACTAAFTLINLTAGSTVQAKAGSGTRPQLRRTTQADRLAAAARFNLARTAAKNPKAKTAAPPVPGGVPDYFGSYPNYANSPLPQVGVGGAITGGIRKFVDSLPGLTSAGANNLGQYIPIAFRDQTTYTGSDYFEIGLVEYTQKLHSDLPATKLRGYKDLSPGADGPVHYLGPLIHAFRDRPVRIKFTNQLTPNSGFFLPVDTTIMGAGAGPLGSGAGDYSVNRGTIHLHGGNTPWISDGTPHQWVVPVGESTPYTRGVSTQNVPDMPDPGPGAMTFYYPNQQSARLLFYHDHAYGITRLNVYAGEAAGYLITDPTEDNLIDSGALPNLGGVYRYGIPLIIQDKTFVPDAAALAAQDPTWNWGSTGNLWYPHVYMPNQNPFDPSGTNAMGRWDYGPWFWPPYTGLVHGPVPNPYFGAPGEPPLIPGTPNPTLVPEAFMDTPLVNGTAYPYFEVGRRAYRFRILNACNDRSLNLQLFYADPNFAPGTPGYMKEVKMVPAAPTPGWPDTWPTDGREGGVPDPATAGPDIIQIGTESGFLPAPVTIPSTPIGYVYNRRDIVVLNISTHALFLGPAERADVLIDFSGVPAGASLILYNDAPAPTPAFDTRYDYFTGDPDQTSTGGAPSTLPGYGPNTRTIMQFRVTGASGPGLNMSAIDSALPTAFAASQNVPHVPESAYSQAYGKPLQDNYARIEDTTMTFAPMNGGPAITVPLKPKAIQELFEPEYGRMNAILGAEIPNTNITTQTTIPYYYVDPPNEILKEGETQYWKITHNGVDTHAVHFHLFDVQLINRVGWDGAIRPPEANEIGWKETVRMNPLEDAIVALRPQKQTLPFSLPNSIRALDVTRPLGSTMAFTNIDPEGNPAPVTNVMMNFGWEYVWHCHLLGHEENDMMRPVIFAVAPTPPTNLAVALLSGPLRASLTWTDNSTTETGFTIQRSPISTFAGPGTVTFATGPNATSYTDTTIAPDTTYFYRVIASTAVGNVSLIPGAYPWASADSAPSNTAATSGPIIKLGATSLTYALIVGSVSTPAQTVVVSNAGGGTLSWTASTAQTWLSVTPASGTGQGLLTIGILPGGLTPGTYNGTISVAAAGASNTPQAISVKLTVAAAGLSAAPFGSFDTPLNNATVQNSIPVTGWALDDIAVTGVKIWRDPWPSETPNTNGYMFVGDALFVAGARPDIEALYSAYPLSYRAGWGYMLLTYGLPNKGNGTYVLHAIASDQDGHLVELGAKTITGTNASASKPFGTIDTPAPGGTASGNLYVNFGWALTPMPNLILRDGSTINVFVDGVNLGHPVYDNYRADIAANFPGYMNSAGAVGYFYLNTTGYAPGTHTIAWGVTDNVGNADGIGSRYFEILNIGAPAPLAGAPAALGAVGDLAGTANSLSGAAVLRGFDPKKSPERVLPGPEGQIRISFEETDRLEFVVGRSATVDGTFSAFQIVGSKLLALPIGSSFDPRSGTFRWLPGPGFLGDFRFVFLDAASGRKTNLTVTVVPKGTAKAKPESVLKPGR